MATGFKEGDRVQIADREATAEDAKSGLFYNHYRGLTGLVQKSYATQEVAVEIEAGSLPEAVALRHEDVQEQMKSKWLDGLSEEARNRLTEQERDFRLRYTVLVHEKDLSPAGKKAIRAAAPAVPATAKSEAEKPGAPPALEGAAPALRAGSEAAEPPRRATSQDLDAAEEAYLRSRQSGSDGH